MKLMEKIKAKYRQVDDAAALVDEHWPCVGRPTNAQRYFRAWTMKAMVMPNGKVRTKRVYCGPCFLPQLTSAAWALNKCLSLFFSLLCCVLLYGGALFSRSAGQHWYIYLPQVLCLLGSFSLVCFTGAKAVTGDKLMLSDLRDASTRLLPCALFTAAMFALAALVMLVSAALSGFSGPAMLSVACMLAALILAAAVFFMEYRTDYIHVFNEYAPESVNPESR